MKKSLLLILVVVSLLSLTTICHSDDLQDVKAAGVIYFGTSADYVPFVYRDSSDGLSGLDIELMEEIGRRMGLGVVTRDMAFDGLIDAVNIAQVDVIGGAFSNTAERQELVDFTDTYYTSEPEIIALAGSPAISQIDQAAFEGKTIGAQRGSSFEQWIRTNLVGAGWLRPKDVYTFSSESDMIKALSNKLIDMAILDEDTYAQKYADSGEFSLVKDDYAKENYAFATRKGSSLTAEINTQLKNMLNDGTAQKIAEKFFSKDFDETSAIINRPSQISVIQAEVQPVQQPVDCVNGLKLISDFAYQSDIYEPTAPKTPFTKVWRVQNTGTCTWDSSYVFSFYASDRMDGQPTPVNGTVAPGEQYDIAVNLIAPAYSDYFTGYWQMHGTDGKTFGDILTVTCSVSTGNEALDWDQFMRANPSLFD